jgi:hypothetical protein
VWSSNLPAERGRLDPDDGNVDVPPVRQGGNGWFVGMKCTCAPVAVDRTTPSSPSSTLVTNR